MRDALYLVGLCVCTYAVMTGSIGRLATSHDKLKWKKRRDDNTTPIIITNNLSKLDFEKKNLTAILKPRTKIIGKAATTRV